MGRKVFILSVYLLLIAKGLIAQDRETDSLKHLLQQSGEDTGKIILLNQLAAATNKTEESIGYGMDAVALSEKLNYPQGKALGLKNLGLYYFLKSDYNKALEYWQPALKAYTDLKDLSGMANILNNMGSINFQQGNNSQAMELFTQSLDAAQKANDTTRIATAMNNVALIYMAKVPTFDLALDYFNKALQLARKIDDKANMGMSYVNMGEIYYEKGNDSMAYLNLTKATEVFDPTDELLPYALNYLGLLYSRKGQPDMALRYFEEALKKTSEIGNKLYMAQTYLRLARFYQDQHQNELALNHYEKARELAAEIKAGQELKQALIGLSAIYGAYGDYKNAFLFSNRSVILGDSLYLFAADSLQLKYAVGLKEKEIALLTKDKDLQELDLKRQKIQKNALMAGLALIFVIVGILYRDYRNKVKTNNLLDHQKAEIEGLLLNILPAEVAKELQEEGYATPKYFDHATVLFTDFKGFTKLADVLSPQELVAELNECFMAFDDIIEKYNLEKIKTIGDSYMCAGGIPTPDSSATIKMIEASFDIIDYLKEWNTKRLAKGLAPWELRIGIHVGPLVAGVVGKKKYAYDIWGSTVNIASRMESAGEPGQVNVSSSVYDIIRHRYECRYRGKISAKNIGEIDMYFVENPRLVQAEKSLAGTVAGS